jgi:hypothetical protein
MHHIRRNRTGSAGRDQGIRQRCRQRPIAAREHQSDQRGGKVRRPREGALGEVLGQIEMPAINEIKQLGGRQHQQRAGLDGGQIFQHRGFDRAFEIIAVVQAHAAEGTVEHQAREQMQAPCGAMSALAGSCACAALSCWPFVSHFGLDDDSNALVQQFKAGWLLRNYSCGPHGRGSGSYKSSAFGNYGGAEAAYCTRRKRLL